MKTNIKLIDLRMQLTDATIKGVQGLVSDYTRVNALKHSYGLLIPVYKLLK